MSNLKTNYKDDVFAGKRKYTQINNGDGTISFNDVTEYTQTGDSYGAAQINETNDVVNNINNKGYKNDDAAETSIADNDYFPFFDSSANAKRKTLWSNIKNVLTNAFAVKNHASNTTAYGTGNGNLYGHVKLSDSYTSSAGAASAAVGASSKALNDAYTANKNSISTLSGTVSALAGTVSGNAATETSHYNTLNQSKAPTNHASSTTTYGKGSSSEYGHLKINDDYNISSGSASDGIAASLKAVRTAKADLNQIMIERDTQINNRLNASTAPQGYQGFYFDYQNGKYGYNTSPSRGADSFRPFKQAYESLGSANCDISTGATTTVSINLSKVPDFYTVGILSIRVNVGHHSEDERFVTIMNSSISGNTCTVTLAHDSKTDGHDVNVSVTVVVYGC